MMQGAEVLGCIADALDSTPTASGNFLKYSAFDYMSKCKNLVYLEECPPTSDGEYKECQQKCLAKLDCGGFLVVTGESDGGRAHFRSD